MDDNQYRDMVIMHDKHIDSLSTSVGTLAENVKSTNDKLDDVISVINTQNVLTERLSNLDINFRDSIERVHTRLDDVELQQDEFISSNVIRWFMGFLIMYSIAFCVYVVEDLTSLRILAVEKIQMQRQLNKNVNEHIRELTKLHHK